VAFSPIRCRRDRGRGLQQGGQPRHSAAASAVRRHGVKIGQAGDAIDKTVAQVAAKLADGLPANDIFVEMKTVVFDQSIGSFTRASSISELADAGASTMRARP
jgi:hypothetical protein